MDEERDIDVTKTAEEDTLFACRSMPKQNPGYDELAKLYAETHDDKYYEWILCYYEKTMTTICRKELDSNNLSYGIADLKTAYALGLYDALQKYDPTAGVPFMVFKKLYVRDRLDNALVQLIPGCTIQSVWEYCRIRKIMRLYNDNEGLPTRERIELVAAETGISPKDVEEILAAAFRNERIESIYRTFEDTDGSQEEEVYLPSSVLSPEQQFFLDLRNEALWDAFDSLPLLERMIVADAVGFCYDCHGIHILVEDENGNKKIMPRNPLPHTEIAALHQMSPKTVAKVLERAYEKMKERLKESEYFR